MTAADKKLVHRMKNFFTLNMLEKVRGCFAKLPEGHLQFGYVYSNDFKGNFVFESIELTDSTLPVSADPVALDCMTQAAAKTVWPARQDDYNTESHTLYWTWPTRGLPAPAATNNKQ